MLPAAVQEVIDEELNKLSFLDNHSAEFRSDQEYVSYRTCVAVVSSVLLLSPV